MTGEIGILNVGAGDTKLIFDKDNPADCIRAARIVKDMLRRGYALLVEVKQADGSKKFQRVHEFRDDTYEYVIADLDPEIAAAADKETDVEKNEPPADQAATAQRDETRPPEKSRRGRPKKTVSTFGARAVAVAHTAGG